MDFDGVSGLESEFFYNGLLLNQRAATATNFVRYKINDIGGFDDADVRDAREVNPMRDGELALPAYYGGRTITFTGKILANNLEQLREMQQSLKRAFGKLEESPLLIRNSPPAYAPVGKFDTVATSFSPSIWFKFNENAAVGAFFDATGNIPATTNSTSRITYRVPGAIANNVASASNYGVRFNPAGYASRSGSEVRAAFPCVTNTKYTVEFWYKTDATLTAGTTVYSPLSVFPNSYSILSTGVMGINFIVSDSKMIFRRVGETTVFSSVQADFNLNTPGWHHIAGSWDGQYTRIFVNGRQFGSVADSTPNATLNAAFSQRIQLNGTASNPDFSMDEVIFFNSAHTEAQIRSRYLAALGVGDRTDQDLEIWVRKSAPLQMREAQSNLQPTRDFLVTLRASDPRFYGTATNTFSVTGSGLATTFTSFNEGEASSEPIIRLTGPLFPTTFGTTAQAAIANLDSGQSLNLSFPATALMASTAYAEINCKTRKVNGSINYSNVLGGSVFPQVISGTNTFYVAGFTGTGRVDVYYKSAWM